MRDGSVKEAVRSLLLFLPPRLVTRTPSARLKRLILQKMNSSLLRRPKEFSVLSPHGFQFSGSTRDVIQRMVYLFGEWEPQITAWVISELREGDTVVDVGANSGYFSLLCARRVGSGGRVIAVEPVPSIFKTLNRNLQANPDLTITPVNAALGAQAGSTTVFRASEDNIGSSSTFAEPGFTSEGTVSRLTGDDLLAGSVDSIRLIKIDVEGDELNVLRGLTRSLAELRSGTHVLVEISPEKLALRGSSAADIWRLFESAKWKAFRIRNDYELSSYGDSSTNHLIALTQPLEERADVIFTRI